MSRQDHDSKKANHSGDQARESTPAAESSNERLGRESLDGTEGLVVQRKSYLAKVKGGAHTGITRDFGKPMLVGRTYEMVSPAHKTHHSADHELEYTADQKSEHKPEPPTAQKPAPKTDQKVIDTAVDMIRAATKRDNFIDTGTDDKTIYATLQGFDRKQDRDALKVAYEKKHHISLENELKGEMSGAELDKALRLLDRPDKKADDAGNIHTLLIERAQLVTGRNNDIIESELRTRLATMNSREIDALKTNYKERFEQDLAVVLKNDPHLSKETKEFVSVYLKGTDKRTTEDVMNLADIALKKRDIDLFRDAFVHSTAEAREHFAKHKGEEKMRAAFEGSPANVMLYGTLVGFITQVNITDRELDRAKGYATQGRLDTASKIRNDSGILGDNEAGIEQTLRTMTSDERIKYYVGLDLSREQSDQKKWSDFQKEAINYYHDVHEALTKAGNATEVARWEDMIAQKGGTLISKLAEQRGMFGRHDTDKVLSLFENIGQEDWDRLNTDAEYRPQLRAAMETFLSKDEVSRAERILDAKLSATAYEQSTDGARRNLLERLADNVHWYGNDKQRMVDAIKHMTPAELTRLRTDHKYMRDLDGQITKALGESPELEEAGYLLRKIARGEAPTSDIVTRVYEHAAKLDTDEGQVVADLQKALRDTPGLRQSILEPRSEVEKQFRKDLEKALHSAMDPGEYSMHIEPLFRTGDISLVSHLELDRGLTKGNMQRFFEGLANASEPERAKLLAADDGGKSPKTMETRLFQEKVFGELSADEKTVARNVLAQREVKPEDAIRLFVLGSTNDPSALKETLTALSPEKRQIVKDEYTRKYGADPTHMVLAKLEGEERQTFADLLPRTDASSRQLFSEALQQYGDSRSGIFGRSFVEAWDGSGLHLDEAMKRYARGIEQSARRFEELPQEKQKQLGENLGKALALYKESKEQAADAAVDGVLAAGSIAAAPFTSGVSLGYLLVAAGAAGAALKVTSKALIVGSDHDWSAEHLAADIGAGFANGMASMIGPMEVAKALRLGNRATAAATERCLGMLSRTGGDNVLNQEARAVLGRGTNELVRHALVNGEGGVSNVALLKLADKLVKAELGEAARKKAIIDVAEAIRHSLTEGIEAEGRKETRYALKRLALNSAAGAAGGTVGGLGTAVEAWDPDRTIGENLAESGSILARSAIIGGASALALSGALEGAAGAKRMRTAQDAKAGTSLDGAVKSGWYREDPTAPMLEYLPERQIQMQGKAFTLQARENNSVWFHTKPRDQDIGPVKVMVTVKDTADLGRLQQMLIPALENRNSELGKLAADYRTLDPRYGAGQWNKSEWSKLPSSERGTVGFQIAASTPEDAVALQKKIDQILGPNSGRTSLVREHYDPAFDGHGRAFGARLDRDLSDAIYERLGLSADTPLAPEQLRTIEQEAGLKEGILTADRNGDLALADLDHAGTSRGGLRSAIGKEGGEYPIDYYLPAVPADTNSGALTLRDAYASLSKRYCNQDPVGLLIKK